MFFTIKDGKISTANAFEKNEKTDCIAVYTRDEWTALPIEQKYGISAVIPENNHFSKLERYSDYMSGSLHIPLKKHARGYIDFLFFIIDRKIIFIDNNSFVLNQIDKLIAGKCSKTVTLEKFLYEFLVLLLDGEPAYLESLENRITKLEEYILDGSIKNFNFQMLEIKKEITKIHRFYSQLTEISEVLIDNEDDFFKKEAAFIMPVFEGRAERVLSEIQSLRDYAMQVEEVYQSEISIKQNDVMKVLTIVTTLFLPLSLIAGWYGMNFVGMHELEWKYGYLFVSLLSAAVVGLCIFIFKKKKLF